MSQGDGIPVQESVERYLSDHPGQRAALTGFVCFLNDRHQACLKIPDTTKAHALRRAKAEKRLVALARSEWSENTFIEWITYAFEYFHGVTDVSQSRVKNMDMISEPLGLSLIFKGHKYFIPLPARYPIQRMQTDTGLRFSGVPSAIATDSGNPPLEM